MEIDGYDEMTAAECPGYDDAMIQDGSYGMECLGARRLWQWKMRSSICLMKKLDEVEDECVSKAPLLVMI